MTQGDRGVERGSGEGEWRGGGEGGWDKGVGQGGLYNLPMSTKVGGLVIFSGPKGKVM